jgi:hypothetical protein
MKERKSQRPLPACDESGAKQRFDSLLNDALSVSNVTVRKALEDEKRARRKPARRTKS